MDGLRGQYARQLNEYDRLINEALRFDSPQQLPRIRSLNVEIGKTLDKMIRELTFLRRNTPTLATERNKLTQRLQDIQKEYNALVATSDQLETLRRIRQQEGKQTEQQLYWYLIVFFGTIVVFLVVMMVFSNYKNEATAPIASTPPMTAALV